MGEEVHRRTWLRAGEVDTSYVTLSAEAIVILEGAVVGRVGRAEEGNAIGTSTQVRTHPNPVTAADGDWKAEMSSLQDASSYDGSEIFAAAGSPP